jgi:hypothetical protein
LLDLLGERRLDNAGRDGIGANARLAELAASARIICSVPALGAA